MKGYIVLGNARTFSSSSYVVKVFLSKKSAQLCVDNNNKTRKYIRYFLEEWTVLP